MLILFKTVLLSDFTNSEHIFVTKQKGSFIKKESRESRVYLNYILENLTLFHNVFVVRCNQITTTFYDKSLLITEYKLFTGNYTF